MRTIFIGLSALLFASSAFANIDGLALRPIVNGNYEPSCNFNEPVGAGLREVAVVLLYGVDSLAGVRFAVDEAGLNWQRLGISSPHTYVGSFDDLSIGFTSCLVAPAVVATLSYYAPSRSPCGTIQPSAAPLLPHIMAALCDLTEIEIQGWHTTINGVYDTPPGGFDPDCYCPAVATRPSTWGQVKALYR